MNQPRLPQTPGDGAAADWISQLARHVLERFPNAPVYTCAAGISPSGIVHAGNLRDVMTSFAVLRELAAMGRPTRFLFSWDNFDRLRKVPNGIDPSFRQHIGKPLSGVPDPFGGDVSYGRHFERAFEAALTALGISVEFRYQTDEYQSGRYDPQIRRALAARQKIADVLLSFMSSKAKAEKGIDAGEFREAHWPISVYSRFTGTDATEILDYDGGSVLRYRCLKTGQDDTVDFSRDRLVKLAWKVDWPMRWGEEGVCFEPGGHDHASPGGSYDVSSVIAREIFGIEPPVFQGYQFIGIQGMGGKMSGSKGDAVAPAELLKIYEPVLLKWLYLRRNPEQAFNLAFDTEVMRQYDEFDREARSVAAGSATPLREKILSYAGITAGEPEPLPFRLAVAFGQMSDWNPGIALKLLARGGLTYDAESVARRLNCARAWLETYNPDQQMRLYESLNTAYRDAMNPAALERVRQVHAFLGTHQGSVDALEAYLYAIPKQAGYSDAEVKVAQRQFFIDLYQLLIGRDTGPRLATFLSALDRDRILPLLSV